jgi:hypothetical protein
MTPVLFTGVLSAAGTAAVTFGVPHVTSGLVSAASVFIELLASSLLREKVTPVVSLHDDEEPDEPDPAPAAS